MKFENLFSKKKENAEPHERILPSDVRYALQYKEGELTVFEVLDLVENGFEQEALYLILKSSASTPELQRRFIEQIVTLVLTSENTVINESLRSNLRSMLTQLSPDSTVDAHKVGVLSRQGFDAWHDLYTKKLRN